MDRLAVKINHTKQLDTNPYQKKETDCMAMKMQLKRDRTSQWKNDGRKEKDCLY